jgi:ADP-ribose pyrophosphatase YjhB (NUDIX family)
MDPTNDLDTLTRLATELQSIAQNGLAYTKSPYDRERFTRVREISARIMSMQTGLPLAKVKDVFCNETGYQTPKLDTRAAIFDRDRILLVQEQGRWSLPGGWVDYDQSVASNTVKEVREEAGLDVVPLQIVAVQDRNRHNSPRYAYGIIKVIVLCSVKGGSFQPNVETTASGFFTLDNLPVLDESKTVYEQIKICFDAHHCEKWETVFD